MKIAGVTWRAISDRLIVLVCLVACLFVVQLIGTWPDEKEVFHHLIGDVIFAVGLLAAADLSNLVGLRFEGGARAVWVIGSVVLAAGLYGLTQGTPTAWMLVIAACVFLSWLDQEVGKALLRNRLGRWLLRLALSLVGAFLPVIVGQIESRFAEEEFFVFVQGVALIPFYLVFLVGQRRLRPGEMEGTVDRRARVWCVWAVGGFVTVMIGLVILGVVVYQNSFFSLDVPGYPGVTAESPFVCGQVEPDPAWPSGEDVFRRLLARVEANPRKGPPEYGMLALGTGEQSWAQAFRESLLSEAAEGRFTEPAHSVKWGQYEAALRAYYLPRVQKAFPGLLSDDDWVLLKDWFADINRRALTVEWVDWMYGLALAKWPEGPYENQENGAGLLALLESEGLAAPELSSANRDYLDRNRRGWVARFRNSDDAFTYQPEWINNALYQSFYVTEVPSDHLRLSFEWLLLQALPDGAPLRYNHPFPPALAGTFYLGARMLDDPRYVWMANRVLADAEAEEEYLSAQPGVESPVSLVGNSPTQGSCLLYGDSGLPNQVGPLAPDKIVFRDGWEEDAVYLLLNLRFTGWHRYKATNTVALVYRGGPIVVDVLDSGPFAWLPAGRSAFRDKRIPRENLNGLLVERSGMGAVLYALTGVGGPWAQDPPHYAEVVAFETGDEVDWSHTRMADWYGWQHDRWIYSYHNGGPIIVIDEASGPPGGQAALVWHLIGEGAVEGQRIRLRSDEGREVLFVSGDPTGQLELAKIEQGDFSYRVTFSASSGTMRAATLFLLGDWEGADAVLDAEAQVLRIEQEGSSITLELQSAER
jgi:hypothetical protein